jgi:hypothetical protein
MTMRSDSMTLASEINERMRMVREFAPNLVCLRAALVPFHDVIVEEFAGPQPEADDYDPDEEPHFCVGVNCGLFPGSGTVLFRFTAHSITVEEWMMVGKGKRRQEVPASEPVEITLDGVFNYLRQLPRPVSSFK